MRGHLLPLSQAVFHVLLALADRRRHRRYYELTELGRRGILVLALCAGGRSPAPPIDKPLVEHIISFADL